jgi:hypothetical protein
MVHLDYYTEAIHGKHEYLDLGHFEFEMGASLPNAKLAYRTYGKLNVAENWEKCPDARQAHPAGTPAVCVACKRLPVYSQAFVTGHPL